MSWSPVKQASLTSSPVPPSANTSHPNQKPYVEVPPPPVPWSEANVTPRRPTKRPDQFHTPSPSPKRGSERDWQLASDDEAMSSRIVPPSTQSRFGGDERSALDRLLSFIDDIFEAEDSVPADGPAEDSYESTGFFSKMTTDWSRPNLSVEFIARLAKIVDQVAQPKQRARRDALFHSPSVNRSEGLSGVDVQLLSRIIKILERSVVAGEDVEPFPGPTVKLGGLSSADGNGKSPSKGKKTKRAKTPEGRKTRSKSRTPVDPDDPTEVDMSKVERALQLAYESVLAADACFAILSVEQLPKQLYSEELITSCLNTVKNQLTRIIYPFLEANSEVQDQISQSLLHIVKHSDQQSNGLRRAVSEIFQTLVSIFPRIDRLVSLSGFAMSESITIQSVFIAIGPFFVAEPAMDGRGGKGSVVISTLGGATSLRGLRLSALSLIRSLFANNEDQRQWIVEEILTSLIKLPDLKHKSGQFRLRDGKSIHTVSALLFQLVQTSPHLLRFECHNLAKKRRYAPEQGKEFEFSEIDQTEISVYAKGLDSAHRVARTIVVFLTQRSGKTKAAKSSNETEYRAILDNLVADLLTVLYLPEWPAATLLLGVLTRLFVASLDDVKTNASLDNSATRATALDHLGTIAARLRAASISALRQQGKAPLTPLEEAVKAMDLDKISALIHAHEEISSYLAKKAAEDQSYSSAQDLSGAAWGHELANALTTCDKTMHPNGDDEYAPDLPKELLEVVKVLKRALLGIWVGSSGDVFSVGNDNDTVKADALSERLGSLSSLNSAFDPILNVILGSLDAAAVFMRTKGLRALGQILASDALVLKKPNVRAAIEEHLLDNSAAVRDAAVELIGKYVLQLPEVANDYYEKIADRILDTGLGVRKRVIKLLKVFYQSTTEIGRRVDISARLANRMLDEDDGVKDLAIKTLEELWFGDGSLPQPTSEDEEKLQLKPTVTVILGVVAQRDRHGNVSDFLHRITVDRSEKETQWLHDKYMKICDALIDTLVDGESTTGFNVLSCVRAVQVIVSAQPSVISSSKAMTLLPYLKHATTSEEQLVADSLLRIFRHCIPAMSKSAIKFGQELQANLQSVIVKPSAAGGLQTMQEAIACFCVVITHITQEFKRVIGLLKSCLARLKDATTKFQAQPGNATLNRQIQLLACMVALIGEHCNLDSVRETRPELAAEIQSISKDSVNEHIYHTLVDLYSKFEDSSVQNRILQCLGFLFRAYPTLMTGPLSADLMDRIFASEDQELQSRLLRILQDFLNSESAKHAAQEKAALKSNKKTNKTVDMDAFVGNTQGFAESGVSSAVVQRYLPQILEAALAKNVVVQNAAVDILGFTIKQGLAHPLQCLPVIIALETSENQQLNGRASALHTILHSKHASLIHSRYLECAQVAFQYQQKVNEGGAVCGFRYTTTTAAVLHKWYSLVKEKRQTRMDFIRTITKSFDVDSTKLSSRQEDVDFVRFIVENLSAFDYKTQEEVLAVIRAATNVLSVAGMQMMEILAPSDLMKQLEGGILPPAAEGDPSEPLPVQEPLSRNFEPFSMARASIILAMLLLLKAHLKGMYGISEEKCAKWEPNKKSAIGDKAAVRKVDRPLYWEKLPFATTPLQTAEDVETQKQRFVQLWEADPAIAEPEDDVMILEVA